MKNSTDLQKIETEYIRNLQQQVYFLELEANFLYPLTAMYIGVFVKFTCILLNICTYMLSYPIIIHFNNLIFNQC